MSDPRCFVPTNNPIPSPVIRNYDVTLSDPNGDPYAKPVQVTVKASSTEQALARALEQKGQEFKGDIQADISVSVRVKIKAVKVDWAETDANGVEVPAPKLTRGERFEEREGNPRDMVEGNRG